MSQAIPQPSSCGDPCAAKDVTTTPGPQGDSGIDGEAGENGLSPLSLSTAEFTVPAVNSNVTIDVSNSSWMIPGEVVYIQNAGAYEVVSTPTNNTVTVKNLGYTENAAPTTVIAQLQKIGPSGPKGADGVAVGVTFNSISPTTTKGDLIGDDGANNPAASNVRFPIGADDGMQLEVDSAQATGMLWKTRFLNFSANLTFGAVGATGGIDDQTIAAVGAAVGDPVSLGTPAAPDVGIVYFAFVSAVDVVTVRATNATAGPITPPAASAFKVRVHK